jgi:hypothetical protein
MRNSATNCGFTASDTMKDGLYYRRSILQTDVYMIANFRGLIPVYYGSLERQVVSSESNATIGL